jgi:hypothetical protein
VQNISNTKEEFEQLKTRIHHLITNTSCTQKDAIFSVPYQQIIGMGQEALPFIFEDIDNNLSNIGFWNHALSSITRIPNSPSTNWKNWAYDNGYLERINEPKPGEYWIDKQNNVWLLTKNERDSSNSLYPLGTATYNRIWNVNGKLRHDSNDYRDLIARVFIGYEDPANE